VTWIIFFLILSCGYKTHKQFTTFKEFLMAVAALYSIITLALVYFLLAVVLCIIRVPETHAAVLFVSVFEGAMALAVSAMIVAFAESAIGQIISMICFFHHRRTEVEKAMTLYFTKAAQEIDYNISSHQAEHDLKMEMGANLKLALASMMQRRDDDRVRGDSLLARLGELLSCDQVNDIQNNINELVATGSFSCDANQMKSNANETSPVAVEAKMPCDNASTISSECSAASTE
jgi:hypothetical protein